MYRDSFILTIISPTYIFKTKIYELTLSIHLWSINIYVRKSKQKYKAIRNLALILKLYSSIDKTRTAIVIFYKYKVTF